MEKILLVLVIGYCFGLLQWSYILTKTLFKQDIRTLGFGNAGASNTVQSLGFKWGLLVGILDILKAVASVLLVGRLFHLGFVPGEAGLLYVNAFGVILGHNFPVHMGFRGGKGTAALAGALLAFHPGLGLLGMALSIAVAFLSDYVIMGTLTLTLFTLFATLFFDLGGLAVLMAVLIILLSLYMHIENVKRLRAGTEPRISRVLKKNRTP